MALKKMEGNQRSTDAVTPSEVSRRALLGLLTSGGATLGGLALMKPRAAEAACIDINGINVCDYATSGQGTLADPFVGWDTGITWSENTTYTFLPGAYFRLDTTVNWAKQGIRINGHGATILCTGQAYLGMEMATGAIWNATIRDLIIRGDGTTTTPLRLQGVADSEFSKLHIGNCTTIGLGCKYVLTSRFESISVSINDSYFTSVPIDGIVLDQRGEGYGCIGNTFIACNLEGLAGSGYKFVWAATNRVIGGTSEGNGYGIHLAPASPEALSFTRNNVFSSIHLELNSIADIYVVAHQNVFEDLSSNGTVKCGDGGNLAFSNRFVRGRYFGAFTIDGHYNVLENVVIEGTLTDNSTTTRYLGDLGLRANSIVGSLMTSPVAESPTLSGVTGLGAGSAAMLTRSSDLAGVIELTAGASAGSSGAVTVTLANTFVGAPSVILQLIDGTGTWNAAAVSPKVTALGTNIFTIAWTNNSVALTAGQTYRIGYMAIGRR